MKKTGNRLLSLVLALSLFCGSAAINVYAATPDGDDEGQVIVESTGLTDDDETTYQADITEDPTVQADQTAQAVQAVQAEVTATPVTTTFSTELEWPFTPTEWVLHKMAGIDIETYDYQQYDDVNAIKRALAVSGQGSMGSPAVTVASADRAAFTNAAGAYYSNYQKLLDQEAQMIKLWLADLATPWPGEDWQHHMSRIAQTEYMFTEAPGYYNMVESSRRTSILGSNTFANNADAQAIMDYQAEYEKKFQEECYKPAKIVEKMIDLMDPENEAEIAAARAAYDELDMLSRSCIMNYQLLTRAEGFVEENGDDKIPDNLKYSGRRKPVGGESFSSDYNKAFLAEMQRALPGTKPWVVWIAGNSSGQMRVGTTNWADLEAAGCLKYPREYYTQMGITLQTDSIMEEFFTYLDGVEGAEVYVQVENMNRLIEPQMDVLSYMAKKHPCVKGFAVDVEWYNHSSEDCGLKVSDYRAQLWNEDIYSHWGLEYSLTLKHYDAHHLPTTYRGGTDGKSNPIIFVDDTQNYGSWDGSHGGRYNPPDAGNGSLPGNGGDWATFAEYFYPNTVVFQTGYQHDPQWTYAFEDPVIRSYGIKIADVVAPDQTTGVAWVSFNQNGYREFPNAPWRTRTQQVTELAARTIAYLTNYNGDSDNLLGGNWGYYSNTAGRLRNSENNPLTVYDALMVRNTRAAFNELVALGGSPTGFTGHTNYVRFVAIEPRAIDIRINALPERKPYKASRDADLVALIRSDYDALTDDQKAQVTKLAILEEAENELNSVPNPNKRPFPQHEAYAVETLKPTGTQAELDAAVVAQFKKILVDYIKDPASDLDGDFRMVLRHGSGGGASDNQITCSESMGYGMVMLAYMAGQDEALGIDVQAYFDGMFRSLEYWPSVINVSGRKSNLMAWELVQQTVNGPFIRLSDGDSATDGDLDMAFALLLADKQWGSDGRYNYLEKAKGMINDLWVMCVDQTGSSPNYHLKIADWATGNTWSVGTRPSDFAIEHLKAFKQVDTAHDWQKVIDATYECIDQLTSLQTPVNGLLPDFAVFNRTTRKWSAAPSNWLEGSSDGRYAANACRTPWRLGTDYLATGNEKIKDICVYPLNEHIRTTSRTVNDMTRIYAGYDLNGTGRGTGTAGSMYVSPFLVTATAFGPQNWLDSGWTYAKGLNRQGNNYGDYINVLTMIVASGNWWSPMYAAPDAPGNLIAYAKSSGVDLSWDAPEGFNGEYRIYKDDVMIAAVRKTNYTDPDGVLGDDYSVIAYKAENNVSDAAVTTAIEAPSNAVLWLLQKMAGIDVEANGYGQYDDIFHCKAMLARRLTVASSMILTPDEVNMFTQPQGRYYDKYQKLLDDDAKAVAIWLEELATQKPGESWQDHFARVQGSEYMFTEAPGMYRDGSSTANANNPLRGVEPGRRLSILGADKFEDNEWGKILIELETETYPKKFQEECYRPAKAVEAMIDDMDTEIQAEVAAARAAYDKLDLLSRASVMNYQLLTRAEGKYDTDGNGKLRDYIPANLKSVGMRKPTGADSGFTAANHKAALSWMQECVPGANPWYIWIAGTSDGVMRIGLPDTDEGWATLEASGSLRYPVQYYKDMGIRLSNDTGAMVEFFAYLDTIPGAEVFLQVENMWKPVEPQMDILSYVAKQYSCVKGFAIDVEWYGHGSTDMGLPVTDYRAKILSEQIYETWGSKYSLALKHYNVQHLPATYRGGGDGKSNPIVFVDDTQNYGSWDGSHGGRYNEPDVGDGSVPGNGGDWALFAQYFNPSPMIFQTGYQQDPQWTYAFDDPLIRSYSIKCAEVVAPNQQIGIAWVNFNRQAYREFPSTDVSTLTQKVDALGANILAKLADYNGDSNNMLGGNFGYYSNAAGASRLPATVYDCLVIRNTRIAANELKALGANLDTTGFLRHAQYNRFLEVEVKACEIRIKALPPLEEISKKHYDKVMKLWETYVELTDDQKSKVESAADLIAAYKKLTFVGVDSVKIDGAAIQQVRIRNTKQFTATVNPTNATDPTLTWESSNEKIFTVDGNGLVKGVGTGSAKLIVTCGGKTSFIMVQITA